MYIYLVQWRDGYEESHIVFVTTDQEQAIEVAEESKEQGPWYDQYEVLECTDGADGDYQQTLIWASYNDEAKENTEDD